jgi:hypothetical protein
MAGEWHIHAWTARFALVSGYWLPERESDDYPLERDWDVGPVSCKSTMVLGGGRGAQQVVRGGGKLPCLSDNLLSVRQKDCRLQLLCGPIMHAAALTFQRICLSALLGSGVPE